MSGLRARYRVPQFRPRDREAGSATVWLLGLVSVLVLAVVAAVLVGSATVLRHRAGAAADLGALAAATAALDGEGVACALAADVVADMGGEVTSCRLVGLVAEVDVVAAADLGVVGVVRAAGSARAGPVTEVAVGGG